MAISRESRNLGVFGAFVFFGFVFLFFWFCVCFFFCFVFLVFPGLASEDFEMDFAWVVLDSFH